MPVKTPKQAPHDLVKLCSEAAHAVAVIFATHRGDKELDKPWEETTEEDRLETYAFVNEVLLGEDYTAQSTTDRGPPEPGLVALRMMQGVVLAVATARDWTVPKTKSN
jgi:hypothetical protein